MLIRRIYFLALLLILLPGTLAAQNGPAAAPDLTEAIAEVDAVFEQWDATETPGCAVAVAEEGRPLLARAYGMADLEHFVSNTPSTIFEAGSISKQFTAAAIVLLAQEGRLSVDDDVRDYVPEVPDYGETITLRHLLTHTSGLRDWGSVASISGWGRSNRTHDHDHVVDIISRQSALNFSPGERYSYSNSGYNLLAVIVERVSDQSFAEFSKERIFTPLGMTNTEWRDDYTRIVEGRSAAYSARNNGSFTINRPIEHVHGNGGLLTTVGDLLIWNRALETGRLGGQTFVEMMHENGQLNNGRTISYAFGLRHGTDNGVPVVNHTGATSGYRAFLARYPEQQLSVALLCNVTNASPGSLGSQVAEVFLDSPPEEDGSEQPEAVSVPTAELEAKAGLYIDPLDSSPTRLVVEDGALRLEDGPTLRPTSPTTFRVGSGNRTFTFQPASGSERPVIQVAVEGYDEGTRVPVEEFDPSANRLADYTGTYHSEDAETTLTLRVEDGELVAERRPGRTFSFSPVYEDAFNASGLGLLRFHRDGQGRVTEMSLSRGRVFDMRFEKID